jgi:hypothetical protein
MMVVRLRAYKSNKMEEAVMVGMHDASVTVRLGGEGGSEGGCVPRECDFKT